jgi:hypothetical protein
LGSSFFAADGDLLVTRAYGTVSLVNGTAVAMLL